MLQEKVVSKATFAFSVPCGARGDAAKLENYLFSKKHFSSVVKGLKTVFSEEIHKIDLEMLQHLYLVKIL